MRLHANDALNIERHRKSGICSGPLGLESSPQLLSSAALRVLIKPVEALVAGAASRCFAASALRAWAVLRRFCDLGQICHEAGSLMPSRAELHRILQTSLGSSDARSPEHKTLAGMFKLWALT